MAVQREQAADLSNACMAPLEPVAFDSSEASEDFFTPQTVTVRNISEPLEHRNADVPSDRNRASPLLPETADLPETLSSGVPPSQNETSAEAEWDGEGAVWCSNTDLLALHWHGSFSLVEDKNSLSLQAAMFGDANGRSKVSLMSAAEEINDAFGLLVEDSSTCSAQSEATNPLDWAQFCRAYYVHPVRLDSCEGDTALIRACRLGSVEIIKLLVETGADINRKIGRPLAPNPGVSEDQTGDTALHTLIRYSHSICSSGRHLDLIRLMVEHGGDPNIVNHRGQTPLMLAAKIHWPRTVQLLLELGSDPNTCDRLGQTALHYCFRDVYGSSVLVNNCLDCARLLIGAGAHMDVTDARGQTPLVLAIKNENIRGARYLIMQNCDPNFPGRTSKVMANAGENGLDADSPFHSCLQMKDLKTLKLLLQAGCRFEDFSDFSLPAEFRAQVQKLVSHPRRLTEWCQMSLRRALRQCGGVGPNLEVKVDELRVPGLMKDFILLRDLGQGFCSVS